MRLPRRHNAGLTLALLATSTLLTGCVSTALKDAATGFGSSTREAAASHKQRVAAHILYQRELTRQALARDRVRLAIDAANCSAQVYDPRPRNRTGSLEPNNPSCRVLRADGRSTPEPPTYRNIVALTSALESYGNSLALLGGDFSADESAFTASLTGLATSAGKLTKAVQGAGGANHDAKLGAIAELIAKAGNLYAAHRRDRVLRQIVISSDPIVQAAINLLARSQQAFLLSERADLASRLTRAEERANDLAHRQATEANVRTAQDELFNLVDALNLTEEDLTRFEAVGVAHSKLAQAARSPASASDMKAAIEAIIDIASTAENTIVAFRGSSPGDQ